MVQKASDRNKEAIISGKVKLISASVSKLPAFDHSFDKIIDINSFQFWRNPVDSLIALKKNMKRDGIIAVVHQPRKPGATEQDSTEAADHFSELLKQAEFKSIRIEKKPMKPVSTICVLGTNS